MKLCQGRPTVWVMLQALQESARQSEAERQQLLELTAPDPPLTVAVLFGGCSPTPGLTLANARSISQFLQTSVDNTAYVQSKQNEWRLF